MLTASLTHSSTNVLVPQMAPVDRVPPEILSNILSYGAREEARFWIGGLKRVHPLERHDYLSFDRAIHLDPVDLRMSCMARSCAGYSASLDSYRCHQEGCRGGDDTSSRKRTFDRDP